MENTTIAIRKTMRKAVEILGNLYCEESGTRDVNAGETVEMAVMECLKRRGVEFLSAPEVSPPPDDPDAPVVIRGITLGSEIDGDVKKEEEHAGEGDPEAVQEV